MCHVAHSSIYVNKLNNKTKLIYTKNAVVINKQHTREYMLSE